jgi:hypothetical protein
VWNGGEGNGRVAKKNRHGKASEWADEKEIRSQIETSFLKDLDIRNSIESSSGTSRGNVISLDAEHLRGKLQTEMDQKGHICPQLFPDPQRRLDLEEWSSTYETLAAFQQALKNVAKKETDAWHHTNPGSLLEADDVGDISALLSKCTRCIDFLFDTVQTIQQTISFRSLHTLTDVQALQKTVKVVLDAPDSLDESALVSPHRRMTIQDAQWLAERVRSFQTDLDSLEDRFDRRILRRDLVALIDDVKKASGNPFRFFNSRWKTIQPRLQRFYRNTVPTDPRQVVRDLEAIVPIWNRYNELSWSKSAGTAVFGELWQGVDSNPNDLDERIDWLVRYAEIREEKWIDEEVINRLVRKEPGDSELHNLFRQIPIQVEALKADLDKLIFFLEWDIESQFGTSLKDVDLKSVYKALSMCEDQLFVLPAWSAYRYYHQEILQTFAAPLVEALDRQELDVDDLLPCLFLNYMQVRSA